MNISYHKKDDPCFPFLLKEIPTCPNGIYIKGDVGLLSSSLLKIAIVGTRKASSQGQVIARDLARELSKRGVVIVSGLALGIDQASHRGCLDGRGRTIAVLATGLDQIYPRQHYALANKILDNGGIIMSEYPSGTPALPHQFLERNRIISGLSEGVVIVEAPEKSGALNTAAHALEQNREVFVVPGSIGNANYIGSNQLLKQGAQLITGASDILDAFNISSKIVDGRLSLLNLNDQQKEIWQIISSTEKGLSIDKICQLTKLESQTVNQILTPLIIDGIIRESGGKYFIN